jgi:hypothetical protein
VIVTYRPEGGPVQSWPYKPKRVRQSRAEMIEKRAEMSFDEFGKALLGGKTRARRVLLWHCLSTDHPTFRWEDTPDFMVSELELSFDAEELQTMRDSIAAADAPEDAKAKALATIDAQLAEAAPLAPAS